MTSTVAYLGWKATCDGASVMIQTPTSFQEVRPADLPPRIRALLRNRAIRPAVLLGVLASEIESAQMIPTAVDRTFAGCRDALESLVLAWNRVFRPMLMPRIEPEPIPKAFGGEGATLAVLGTPITVYYPAQGGTARLRTATEDVVMPRDLRLALVAVAVAAGIGSPTRSCGCGDSHV